MQWCSVRGGNSGETNCMHYDVVRSRNKCCELTTRAISMLLEFLAFNQRFICRFVGFLANVQSSFGAEAGSLFLNNFENLNLECP